MVSGLAVANLGVWIALHNSAVLRLFHATTFECLCDVNVAPTVTKMLAGEVTQDKFAGLFHQFYH